MRDLAERGVLEGKPGAFSRRQGVLRSGVPATLQATIAARIDRLDPSAKRTLGAAAVMGSRFDLDLLMALGIDPSSTGSTGGPAYRSGEVHEDWSMCSTIR